MQHEHKEKQRVASPHCQFLSQLFVLQVRADVYRARTLSHIVSNIVPVHTGMLSCNKHPTEKLTQSTMRILLTLSLCCRSLAAMATELK